MKNDSPYSVRFLQFETREREALERLRNRDERRKRSPRRSLRERFFGPSNRACPQ